MSLENHAPRLCYGRQRAKTVHTRREGQPLVLWIGSSSPQSATDENEAHRTEVIRLAPPRAPTAAGQCRTLTGFPSSMTASGVCPASAVIVA